MRKYSENTFKNGRSKYWPTKYKIQATAKMIYSLLGSLNTIIFSTNEHSIDNDQFVLQLELMKQYTSQKLYNKQ